MLNWLKRMLGIAPIEPKQETLVLAQDIRVEETAKPKKETTTKPKKTTKKAAPKKKEAAVDLATMKKDELLAHAKKLDIKANASMNKAALLEAIKNG